MKKEERENFWKLDDKLYIIEKNKNYKLLFKKYVKYNSNKEVQEYIDRLIAWYLVRYSDKDIDVILNKGIHNIKYSQIYNMSFLKLKERTSEVINFNKIDEILYHQFLVILAGWGLIYSKKTNPEYGLFRVDKMFDDFNKYYNWNLNTNIYKSILEYDYSFDNPDIIDLLNPRKYSQVKKKKRFKFNKK